MPSKKIFEVFEILYFNSNCIDLPRLITCNNCPCNDYNSSNHWIDCDSCGQWWHSRCVSLNKEACNAIVKGAIKYFCPFCIIKNLNLSDDLIKHRITTSADNSTTDTTVISINENTPTDNYYPNTPNLPSTPVCHYEPNFQSKGSVLNSKKHSSSAKFNLNDEYASSTSDSVSHLVDQSVSLSNNTNKLPCNTKQVSSSQSNNTEKLNLRTKSSDETFIKPSVNHNKFIVIIDGIKDPDKFKSSPVIKSEINRCKPSLSFFHCYSLPAGGISIHCRSKEDLTLALLEWPVTAFNNSPNLHLHLPSRNLFHSKCSVIRLYNNRTKLPLPIIKITFEDHCVTQNCLLNGVYILGVHLPVFQKGFAKL